MKRSIIGINAKLILAAASICFTLNACTDNFYETNTDPNAATEEELGYDNLGFGSLITQMEYQLNPCVVKDQNVDVNNYQKMFSLAGDVYSGQQGASNMFENNGHNNTTYSMTPDWCTTAYTVAYQNYMNPWYSLYTKKNISPTTFAVGQILKVYGMHRITDMYGPIPYKNFVPASDVPFTPQEEVYDQFFQELDEAVDILQSYVKANPGVKPLAAYDNIYNGNFAQWIKFANSLKLRLALRIVYADEAKAKAKAEEAIKAGVFKSNEDNAMIHVNGSSTVNPLYMICHTYNDTRLGATMECYLKGYNDPRLKLWFLPSEISDERDYNGVRNGIIFEGNEYKVFSKLNVSPETPIQIMTAAEVYFLCAEAALRGWETNGTSARDFYEQGIRIAFDQPIGASGAKAGDAEAYLEGEETPKAYTDVLDDMNSYDQTGQVSVNWEADNDDEETLLEKIITQKWIALFPDGQEAWSEFRRTGFPMVIPNGINYSGGSIDTQKQIARLPYPNNLQHDYPEQYAEGLKMLKGADNGGTKLWWDKRTAKPYEE